MIWMEKTSLVYLSDLRADIQAILPSGCFSTSISRARKKHSWRYQRRTESLDCLLTTMVDALRPESDCILIARPDAISDLDPVITESQYVLTPHTVPFDRFCGVWSLIDRAWLEIPNDGELARMNNYKSDVDIAMHIAHHQFYWEKKNEIEQNNENWQRSDYVHYATGQLSDQLIVPRPLILLLLLGRPVIFGLTKNSFL